MPLAVHQATSSLRRHTDPPGLWFGMVVGSLVLNGVLFMSFQRYLQPVKTVAAFAPISVDFVSARSPLEVNSPASSKIAPTTNSSVKTAPAPSANPVTDSNPGSIAPKAGEISIAPSAKSSGSLRSDPPSIPSIANEHSTSSQSTQTDTSAPNSRSDTATGSISAQNNPSIEDTVATSGVILPGFAEPPDPGKNPGESDSAATDSLSLNRKALVSKYMMQVKVLPREGDPGLESSSNASQQNKTFVSGEAGCFVTPEALSYFDQSLDYVLTLSEQGNVLDAVPMIAVASDQESYQNLATCSLKTWRFERSTGGDSSAQSTSNKLAVQVILQKE